MGQVVARNQRDEVVDLVRQRVDLAQVVSRYVKLKKVGSNLVGLCPFHSEKTPSFSVSPTKGFFHCFGCKASGDVFTFLMRMEGKTFPEVLEELAGQAGVELPARSMGTGAGSSGLKMSLYRINEVAAALYQELLWDSAGGRPGREYLQGRGVEPELARRFGLGFVPVGGSPLVERLRKAGLDPRKAEQAGLLRGRYEVFRGRLVFPIRDARGNVLGFGARSLSAGQGPKYINSRQSAIYDKSRILYGLFEARPRIVKDDSAVLVEGYFDVLAAHAAGVTNAVATCGTALTAQHASMLRRFTGTVVAVFDGDSAGWAALERAAKVLFAAGHSVLAAGMPPGQDPDSIVRDGGAEQFRLLVENARPALELLGDKLMEAAGSVEARTKILKRLAAIVASSEDRLLRATLSEWLAGRFAVDPAAVLEEVERLRMREATTGAGGPGKSEGEPGSRATDPAEERSVLLCLLKEPSLAKQPVLEPALKWLSDGEAGRLVRSIAKGEVEPDPALVLSSIEQDGLRAWIAEHLLEQQSAEQVSEQFGAAVRLLKRKGIVSRLRELTFQIGQAEKEGRQDARRRLLVEKMQLNKQLATLDMDVEAGA